MTHSEAFFSKCHLRCIISFFLSTTQGITHASVATRSWSSTCWLVVRPFLALCRLVQRKENVISPVIIASALLPGAKCEANTFDGERCMYGCLNDSVRRMLKEYKCVGVQAMQREGFDYCLHMWGTEENACEYSIYYDFSHKEARSCSVTAELTDAPCCVVLCCVFVPQVVGTGSIQRCWVPGPRKNISSPQMYSECSLRVFYSHVWNKMEREKPDHPQTPSGKKKKKEDYFGFTLLWLPWSHLGSFFV